MSDGRPFETHGDSVSVRLRDPILEMPIGSVAVLVGEPVHRLPEELARRQPGERLEGRSEVSDD